MGRESTSGAPAGLLRRLAALFYDLLLALALAFVATFAMLPLTRGEAILASTPGLVGHAYHALIAFVAFAYFGWSWTRGGQTLGMRAWRIRLESADGRPLRWPAALARFVLGAATAWLAALGAWYLRNPGNALEAGGAAALVAPLVANFAWAAFDAAGRTLIDRAVGSRVSMLA